ncbi:MnhB domain-containing protein [Geomesophilobacter sediminis]|uniref:Na+/H+ antiporter MnhB subunit-related protein domain-containing protein n=1 Tax=Geomesophilobacter sediminis TaxID=2798584 RepID=A0A8J7JMS0_9BACT|nr:MnhB domain-containing protein [Geomesophilobacter sediminis]MBJ6726110.1 hypothetical protein [Geomesophilobacter sediminis]
MNDSARRTLFFFFAAILAGALVAALRHLPSFGDYQGPYGDVILSGCIPQRHTPQGVAAVTFDYRGFDTLGEEFILFTAVAGVLLLLRQQQCERQEKPRDCELGRAIPATSSAVLAAGLLMFPAALLLGCSLVLHGHLTPGGGFQGGVLLATAFYFVYLSSDYRDLTRFTPDHLLDYLEVTGATTFALGATLPLVLNRPFMLNLLPLGKTGSLFSAGFLPLFNCSVGVEVGAGFLLLIAAFLKQVIVIRRESDQ